MNAFFGKRPFQSVVCKTGKFHSNNLFGKRSIVVNTSWADGSKAEFSSKWLRDNCRCGDCLDMETGTKLFNTAALTGELRPQEVYTDNNRLYISWEDGHKSNFSQRFLFQGEKRPPIPGSVLWEATDISVDDHYFEFNSEKGLDENSFFMSLWSYGFAIVRTGSVDPNVVTKIAGFCGPVKQTSHGKTFEVETECGIDYRKGLPEEAMKSNHTDMNYKECTPGIEFLQCIHKANDDTMINLVDGFKTITDIAMKHPEHIKALTNQSVVHRLADPFGDKEYQHRTHTVIMHPKPNHHRIRSVHVNNRTLCPINGKAEDVEEFYDAYANLLAHCDDPQYILSIELQEGDVLAFHNRRILHGRSQARSHDYLPSTKFLRGCYVDNDEFLSTFRAALDQS
eukprot:TRINITY_DN777842_c0_g1_i1.p1 TRINITY_DN777842_c0_g1~~TRINITY_DN777842_c0_g1_i1.p1  ORF type:complete len:396 (+),score=83.70 TRINITY_DN777842_c0_g1_i1:107-1294(+)